MPYPSKIDYHALLEKARDLIETEGIEQLSLQKLADGFGVKAPSLYKHVENKNALLRAVVQATTERLTTVLMQAVEAINGTPHQRLEAMMRAYREFAHQNPGVYRLAFGDPAPEIRPDPADLVKLALPLQAEMVRLVGEMDSLAALRGAWALIHGFVMLELSTHFQRGGDLDATFEQAIQAYLNGLEAREDSA